MLLQFSVENFLSFREEAVLNLTAAEGAGDPKHPAYAEAGGERVLRCAALYGANASGKSNLVRALDVARRLAVDGAPPDAPLDVTPFRLDEALRGRPSRFTFHVALDGKRYEYGLEADTRRVTTEHLYESDVDGERLVFERSVEAPDAGFRFGPGLVADASRAQFLRFVAEGTRPNQPFLAEARQRNVGELARLSGWLDRELVTVGPTGHLGGDLEARLDSNDELRRAFARLLRSADVGIRDLAIERTPFEEMYNYIWSSSVFAREAESPHNAVDHFVPRRPRSLDPGAYERLFWQPLILDALRPEPHFGARVVDQSSGKAYRAKLKTHRVSIQGDQVTFDLSEESDGTRRLIELGLALLPTHAGDLAQGALLIDELERSLHPLLCRFFVNAFLQAGGAARRQLIFTTHDTNLLNRNLLPADAVWFAQKDAHGASKLYSLADFKPDQLRELTGTLEAGYLQGRFGAIPFLGDPTALGWHGPSGGPGGGKAPPSKTAQAKSTTAGEAPAKGSTGSRAAPAKANTGSSPAKGRAGAGPASAKRSAGAAKKGGRSKATSTRRATRAAAPEAKTARSARRTKSGAS